jgi:aminoglycoside phosphotransferase (APT) family kinase protein
MAAEAECPTEGTAVCHGDLRSDNLCLVANGAKLLDWPEACLSNPSLDLGLMLPSLAEEGGPEPEVILPDAPEVAAWVSGFFAARTGLPPIPGSPGVRPVQLRQLRTALPWVRRALALPLPR